MDVPVWDHPTLGGCAYDDGREAWVVESVLPAFAAFTYTLHEGDAPRGGRVRICFETDDDRDPPTDAAAALATQLVANEAWLARAAGDALWDDFNGRGPGRGVWGRDALSAKTDRDLPPLTSADAVMAWLMPTGLRIFAADDGSPLAELTFAAEFEREHNVGVLTDGAAILGLGHQFDRVPFEHD